MSRAIWSLVFLSMLLSLPGCASVAGDPRFAMTLRVVNDQGDPVEGAQARIGAGRRSKPGEPEGLGIFADGLTDEAGIFFGEVRAVDGYSAGYRVENEGHYQVWEGYRSRGVKSGRWQPWNPTINVVLKRIRNPVPMYAARWMGLLPVFEEWVGFDLEVADWVAPHGKGMLADVELFGTGQFVDNRNVWGRVTLRFVGPGNGMILYKVGKLKGVSAPRLPYEAPETGYASDYTWERVRRDDPAAHNGLYFRDGRDETENFFIRVRSQWDEEGSLVSAWYGKIHGPTEVMTITRLLNGGPWRIGLAFTYLVNPDGTRNVEFDQKRNLLKTESRRRDFGYEGIEP